MANGIISRRGGGGGGGINLNIVGGTTQPAGSGNTIWVNTDTAINGYAFSNTEPESPVEGMVWIQTGASSSAGMNIGSKNTVMLYPTACKQYIGGAWVDKIAQTYLNGEWQDWIMYLYNYGQTNLYFTFTTDYASNGALEANYIHMESTNKYGGTVSMSASPAIDLTPYNTAKIEVENTGSYATMTIGFGASLGAYGVAYWEYKGEMAKQTVSIDISDLSGSYYLGGQRITNSDSRAVGVTKIHSIYLE